MAFTLPPPENDTEVNLISDASSRASLCPKTRANHLNNGARFLKHLILYRQQWLKEDFKEYLRENPQTDETTKLKNLIDNKLMQPFLIENLNENFLIVYLRCLRKLGGALPI